MKKILASIIICAAWASSIIIMKYYFQIKDIFVYSLVGYFAGMLISEVFDYINKKDKNE